jgi:hypothetical protein
VKYERSFAPEHRLSLEKRQKLMFWHSSPIIMTKRSEIALLHFHPYLLETTFATVHSFDAEMGRDESAVIFRST